MKQWNISDFPDLHGKRVVVTGGNAGLGFQSVLELARKNAEVIIACRREKSGEQAIQRVHEIIPAAKLSCITLDLTDFQSIMKFCEIFISRYDALHILLNNAGVVNLKTLQYTSTGHEMHMATNHYGHFALTTYLFPVLLKTPNARVVTMTSGGYRFGNIRFDDMDWKKRSYKPIAAYSDSKLANLLFTYALQTRFEEMHCDALSLAAHPGLTATERQQSVGAGGKLTKFLASSVMVGVAPQLRACTDLEANKRDFYGPRFGIYGSPIKIKAKEKAKNSLLAEELWDFTENIIRKF